MIIEDELLKAEVSKMLNEKLKKYITKIIDDFNKENHGVEIDTIEMQNVHYILSIKGGESIRIFMNENDIKAILWLLTAINEDKMIASYFRAHLNSRQTDIRRLINQFRDIVKMLENPMYYKGDNIDIPITPNVIVTK